MKQDVQPKYQKIVASLRDQITAGALSQGDALPSYRALMEQYGTTVGVVRQAMQVLQSDGLVESVRRVGCRVAKVPVKCRMVGIAIAGYAGSNFHLDQIRALHDDLSRCQTDVAIRFISSVDDEQAIEAACAWAQRQDGVLLTGRVPLALAQRLSQTGVPLVLIGELIDAPVPVHLSAVSIDIPSMVRLAVSHLAGLGHRRIALDSGHGTRYYDMLREAFEACSEEFGLHGLWLRRCDDGSRPSVDLAFRTVTSAEDPPTAILVEGGPHASRLVERLEAAGWRVPERISVMAISAAVGVEHVRPNLTCVLTSTREMLQRAVQMLNDQIDSASPPVRVERLAAGYVPGDTCGGNAAAVVAP